MTTTTTPTTATLVTRGARQRGQARSRRRVEPIYYCSWFPALILFTLAITVPAVIGIFFSFTNSIGFGEWQFIGLTNYIALFSDPAIVAELPVHVRVLARHGRRRSTSSPSCSRWR